MLTKQEAKKIVEQTKGEARGVSLRDDLDFILDIKGEQGLKRVEDRMAELGYPLKRKDVNVMSFYPMGLADLYLLVIQEIFNFNKKELEKWGASIVKFSIFTKVFMKYFGSLQLMAAQTPRAWKKHYTAGDLEMPEYSREKRYVILRLSNFKFHPIHCPLLTGMFLKISQMVIKQPTKCKETKCMFRGDPYHEFLITW